MANSNLILSGEIREACLLCVHERHLAEGAAGLRSQLEMAVASFSLEPSNRTAEGSVDGQTGAHPIGLAQEEQARLRGTFNVRRRS